MECGLRGPESAREGVSPLPAFSPSLHRPHHALILRHLRDALEHEPLGAPALVRLRREDVALRVGRDAVHAEELPRLPAAIAETRDDLERVAKQDVHPLVLAVSQIEILLLGIRGERNVPRRPVAARLREEVRLLHERAVRLEDLDAIVLPVADVDKAVVRQLRAVHRSPELLNVRRRRIVLAEWPVVGLLAVAAPIALDRTRVAVDDRDAPVPVPVADVALVGLRIHEDLRRRAEILGVVAALALAAMPELGDELAVLRELEKLRIGVGVGANPD